MPPTPRSTKNMPPGLARYWNARGVGTGGSGFKQTREKKKSSSPPKGK